MSHIPFTDIDLKYNYPPGLLASMWKQESNCGALMVSPAGAKGHFQFMPDTRPEVMREIGLDPWSSDPRVAAECAAYYLNKQLKRFGSLDKALAAYNAGGGRVNSALNKHGESWLSSLTSETRNYVPQILDRIGMADRMNFTNLYVRGEMKDTKKIEEERTRRHSILTEVLGMSKEDIAKMSDAELFGTSFLAVVISFVKTLVEGAVALVSPSLDDKPTPPPTPGASRVAAIGNVPARA